MQAITVELQDSFSYLPVILFIIMGIIGTLLILFLKFKIKPRKPRVPVPKPAPPQSIMALKDKHIRALNQIEKRHSDGKISDRQAFQAVSRVVRDFVYAATGIKVQNYTLMEIHKAGLPLLYELISQCYIPEFAADSEANINEVINKARTVISQWN